MSTSALGEPEQLTIDINIARDYLDSRRRGHVDAVVLFDLARSGFVELATAPQGYRLDVQGTLSTQLRSLLNSEGVLWLPQVARVSKATYPSKNLYPGAYISYLPEAWNSITAKWQSHERKPPQGEDFLHIETHMVARRDIFITNDKALITMCNRLRSEHNVEISAKTLRDYLATRSNT